MRISRPSLPKKALAGASSLLLLLAARHYGLKMKDRKEFFSKPTSPSQNEFFTHIKENTSTFSDYVPPFVTKDLQLLDIAEKMGVNRLPLPHYQNTEKFPSVVITECTDEIRGKTTNKPLHLFVGGFPVANTAYAYSQKKQPVLYVNADKDPTQLGAAQHFERANDEMPTYMGGYNSLSFARDMLIRVWNPRLYANADKSNYPWKSFSPGFWIQAGPKVWFQGLAVFVDNLLWSKACEDPQTKERMKQHVIQTANDSEKFLMAADERLKQTVGQGIFRPDLKGSVYVAKSSEELASFRNRAQEEPHEFREASLEEVPIKEGTPFIKEKDRVFEPTATETLKKGIQHEGGEVSNLTLSAIYVNSANEAEIAKLINPITGEEQFVRILSLHTSLGPAPFSPTQSNLAAVAGNSMLAIIPTHLSQPVVCGQSNHVVPLFKTTINGLPYTLARLTNSASVRPANMGTKYLHSFLAQDAITLHQHAESTLGFPVFVLLHLVCNRHISGKNFPTNAHLVYKGKEVRNAIRYDGPGGSGLTLGGSEAQKFLEGREEISYPPGFNI